MTSMNPTPDDDTRRADDTGRPAHRADDTGDAYDQSGRQTEADRIRSDDIVAEEPYAGAGDEDALLTDAERIRARDIDQS